MSRIKLLEDIIECVPLAIFAKESKNLRYVVANKAFRETAHIPEGELKTDYDYFPDEQADFFREKDLECLQNREMVFIPQEPVGDIFARTWKVPILGEDGAPTHLLGIFEDITELVEVRQRAEDLDRNRRRIIHNLDVGFFLLSRAGKILDGYTDSCAQLLGERFAEGVELAAAANLGHDASLDFAMALEQLFDDILPEEISLDMMRLQTGNQNRTVDLVPSPIRDDDGKLDLVLFSVNDSTQLQAERKKSEHNASLIHVLKNIEAFQFLMHDVAKNLQLAREVNQDDRRTILHTLKGNIAQFGLTEVKNLIHQIENEQEITDEHLEEIDSSFREFLEEHEDVLNMEERDGPDQSQFHAVPEAALEDLERTVELVNDAEQLKAIVSRWVEQSRWKPVGGMLKQFADSAQALAGRLEKEIRTEVIGADTRLDFERCGPILSNLIHLV
ncbi:MAG: PAS domain-containing protein [Planctomycetota bacterium]